MEPEAPAEPATETEGKVNLGALGSYLRRADPASSPKTYGHSGKALVPTAGAAQRGYTIPSPALLIPRFAGPSILLTPDAQVRLGPILGN